MILRGYGIGLIRLRHEDIELVRQMRNADHVRRYMEYRELITPEMQEQWFRSIDNPQNNYFLIEHEGKKAGLISGAQINWETRETGNGGIFIWEENLWGTTVPLFASLLLTDLSFVMGMERTYIKVLRDNPRAIAFVTQIGYALLPGQEEVYNQHYVLTEAAYRSKTEKLRALLHRHHDGIPACIIDDPEHPSSKWIAARYAALPPEKKAQLKLVITADEPR